MQKITPHLWYDKEAIEAATFYTSIFPNSKITHTSKITGTPSGDCDIVSFDIMGTSFQAISAGPYFMFNPSISLMINFDPSKDSEALKRIDEVWNKLAEGAKILMPIDKYPFSERYGWLQDKYGLSWQLIYTNPEGEERPPVIPAMLFVKDVHGKAEEATDFYISIFKNSQRGILVRHTAHMEPEKEGTIMFTDFNLSGQWFSAMDSANAHEFIFNEAFSFMINCDTQEEIDYFWEKLSAVPESEQCGWLKDKYGVSWQVVPTRMNELMNSGDQAKIDKVTQAFLKMKKINIAELEAAASGK